MATFQSILGNATQMDNGFIVLEHDLFEQTVDLAIGYTLPAAQSHSPAFTVRQIFLLCYVVIAYERPYSSNPSASVKIWLLPTYTSRRLLTPLLLLKVTQLRLRRRRPHQAAIKLTALPARTRAQHLRVSQSLPSALSSLLAWLYWAVHYCFEGFSHSMIPLLFY